MRDMTRKNFCIDIASTALAGGVSCACFESEGGDIVIHDRRVKNAGTNNASGRTAALVPNAFPEDYTNKFLCGDSAQVLTAMPAESVDLIVTSPPYDGIRDYKGFTADLSKIGKESFRVLKNGGVAVVVIQDQTKNFGKSLTSFRLAIDWCDNAGFKLFECLIYKKLGAEGAWWNKRFRVDHEYMMVFLKGDRPSYFNKEPLKIPSKHGGKTMTGGGTRLTNGTRIETRAIHINPMKCRGTVWVYETAGDGSRLKHQHPATYPDQLPYDFIQCFCPEGGLVLDPFIGSGTTALAAKALKRNYIGIDISQEYISLCERRIVEDYDAYIKKAEEWRKSAQPQTETSTPHPERGKTKRMKKTDEAQLSLGL